MSNLFGSTSGSSTPAFGQNTSGSGAGGGLFGNVGASQETSGSSSAGQQPSPFNLTSGSAFNLNKPDQAKNETQGSSQPPSLFGNSTPNKPGESGTSGSAQPPGLFGGVTSTPSSGGNFFGGLSTTPAGPPPGGLGSGLFGAQAPRQDGTAPPATTTMAAMTSTTPATTNPSQNLFGGSTGTQPQQQGSSVFPGAGTTAPSTGGLFNLNQDKKDETPKTLGAGTTKADDKPSPFGSANSTPPATQSSGSLFGSATQTAQKPSFSFPPATSTSTPSPLAAATGAESAQKSLFPTAGSAATPPSTVQSSTPATTAAAPSPSSGLFGPPQSTAAAAATDSTSAPTTTPSGGNMFAGVGKSAPAAADSTTAPAASGNMLGNIGKSTSTTSAATPASAGGSMFGLGKPATTTTTSAPAETSTAATTAATTSEAAKTTTAGTGAGGVGLGTSTVGPAPPAQSRLKNKTMDEIITRWATDMTKYQKEFQEQAEQVAECDRMLVENTDKVQKLYGNTVDAERATQEVERQLSSVEGQQDELSSWLDRYEQEVDALLSKQVGSGDTLQGPDQERERT